MTSKLAPAITAAQSVRECVSVCWNASYSVAAAAVPCRARTGWKRPTRTHTEALSEEADLQTEPSTTFITPAVKPASVRPPARLPDGIVHF